MKFEVLNCIQDTSIQLQENKNTSCCLVEHLSDRSVSYFPFNYIAYLFCQSALTLKHLHCSSFVICQSDGQPFLASGGSSGVINIWNLKKRKLQSVIREAHDASIASLYFLANEPVLMSSAADNSIKVWTLLSLSSVI